MLISRLAYMKTIHRKLSENPVVALLGVRQCGKTTLARLLASNEKVCHYFDLEDPASAARLQHPSATLDPLKGLVIIDEAQRQPELFPLLRVLADRDPLPARFLILGSASPSLVRSVSETLAGRVGLVDMSGFDLGEVGPKNVRRLWLRGGLPRSYLAKSDAASLDWRNDFIKTFLERDLPQLGITIPSATLRRFWTMLAHFHAQVWNAAELARSLGATEPTARRYLDILTSAFVVRQLPPWYENIAKRQVKAPKVYLRDSGLVHALLALGTREALEGHPRLGASWEGFALEQVLRLVGDRDAYFWATQAGAELDLFFLRNGRRYGVEFKYTDAPTLTKSMHVALADLRLEHLWVVYPGRQSYPLHDRVEAISILNISQLSAHLKPKRTAQRGKSRGR